MIMRSGNGDCVCRRAQPPWPGRLTLAAPAARRAFAARRRIELPKNDRVWAFGLRGLAPAFQNGRFSLGLCGAGVLPAVVNARAFLRRIFVRRRASLVEKRRQASALQRQEPDERQPFPRHRLSLPYSTCQKSNGCEKSGDRCQIICLLDFALTAHCPLCPLPAHRHHRCLTVGSKP